eukprot:1156789-Pelagomonas_calceolata.AAC.2
MSRFMHLESTCSGSPLTLMHTPFFVSASLNGPLASSLAFGSASWSAPQQAFFLTPQQARFLLPLHHGVESSYMDRCHCFEIGAHLTWIGVTAMAS